MIEIYNSDDSDPVFKINQNLVFKCLTDELEYAETARGKYLFREEFARADRNVLVNYLKIDDGWWRLNKKDLYNIITLVITTSTKSREVTTFEHDLLNALKTNTSIKCLAYNPFQKESRRKFTGTLDTV